jgi:hypothetical protein
MQTTPPPRTRKPVSPFAEWLDARQAFQLFTLGRTTLSRLAREKKIVSCSLAEEGMARGKKLYQAESIRDYLNSRVNAA